MRECKQSYGYVVDEEKGYRGVITQDTLESVNEDDYNKLITSSLLENVPTVQSDDLLEVVIPDMIDNQHPLPVLNAKGEVEGHLCRRTLVEVLSDQSSTDNREKVKA